MPPRPRPRPKTAAASSSSVASTSTQSPTPIRNTSNTEDDDAFFMRKVSAAERMRYDQLNEESERTGAAASTSQDDSDGEVTRPGTGRWRKKAKSPSAQPVGTRRQKLPKEPYISSDNDEKSDSSLEILDTPGASSDTKGKKRARSRSLSKSLTPPPALPQHQIQYAKNLVRMALKSTERPPSPKSGEEEPDNNSADEDLDPELAKIRQQVRTRQRTSPLLLDGEEEQRSTTNVDAITVRWQPHPKFSTGKSVSWSFMLGHMETFRKIFEEVSKKTGIIFDNIVMTYNSKRIFSSASPHMLSIYTQAELVACDKLTYEYLRTNRETFRSPSPELGLGGLGEHDQTGQESETESRAEGGDNEDDDNDGTFKIIVRSSLTTKDITLTIRPTTTCGAIVKGFLKKAGLADQYSGTGKNKNPVLSIDGERMSPDAPIGDADLEEGDIVDVMGL